MPWPMRLGPPPRMTALSRSEGAASQAGGPAKAALVGRVHVGGGRGELGRAGVDALVDRAHSKRVAAPAHLRLGELRQPGEARVREPHRLEIAQPRLGFRQPVRPDQRLRIDDLLDARQEPRIDAAGGMDLGVVDAQPHGLRDLEQPVRRRHAQCRADHVLVVAGAEPFEGVVVEAGEPRLQAAQRLLQAFREAAPDRHRLAHRLHRRGQHRLGAGELLEGEARHLGDDVVDGGLERGRRGAPRYVVLDLVQRVADGELGGDLGDREARRLGGERGGARHARVHLDDDEAAVVGVDGELHVGAAGLHPDLAQHRDRGVAHHLVFLVRQRQGRGDRDAVARVHAHRVDVLDGADDDAVVRAVADHLHLELLPAEHALLDQHLARHRGVEAALDDLEELLAVEAHPAAGAPQRKRGPDDRRQADMLQRRRGLLAAVGEARLGGGEADAGHGLAEQLAVLGHGDGLGLGADHLHAVPVEHALVGEAQRDVERGLPAHGRQQCVGALFRDDLGDELRRHRLDVGGIGQLRIRHDGGRIGVDEDDAVALGSERLAGLGSGIVELAGLADHDRPRTNDEDGFDVRTPGHEPASYGTAPRNAIAKGSDPSPPTSQQTRADGSTGARIREPQGGTGLRATRHEVPDRSAARLRLTSLRPG